MTNLKFPFCFYEDRIDEKDYIALYDVRFRHQFHPDMKTNIAYNVVYIDPDSWVMTVCGDDCGTLFKVEMELHLKPVDPHAQ